MTMRRRRPFDQSDEADLEAARSRSRSLRVISDGDSDNDGEALPAEETEPLGDVLVSLCSRFGLEAWASSDEGHGLRAFGAAVAEWLDEGRTDHPILVEFQLESIRLLTNLLVIVGAAIRVPKGLERGASDRARSAVTSARRLIASQLGPVPSSPGSARAMERLVRVRGWNKLAPAGQAVAESLLELYLETLAAMLVTPDQTTIKEVLLATCEAWLSVLHSQALPAGFDERLLRATSWYLESYTTSRSA
jgi:hypothetical protein